MPGERIDLTVPVVPPTISSYVPGSLCLELLPVARIVITLVHVASGKAETFEYPSPPPCRTTSNAQVATLIDQLNTANLSNRSLWRQVCDRLVIDFPSRFPGGATVV